MDRNYCANTNLYTVNDLIVNFRGSMRGRLIDRVVIVSLSLL